VSLTCALRFLAIDMKLLYVPEREKSVSALRKTVCEGALSWTWQAELENNAASVRRHFSNQNMATL
jgi:hypothetical protein